MDYRRIETTCVTCGTPMTPERTDAGHVLDRCATCGGVWMITDEFLAELRAAQPRLVLDELPEQNDGSPRRPCPRCGEHMAIVWLEFLKLDQCSAHGVWFDGGELDRALGGKTTPDYAWLRKPRRWRR